MSELATRPPQQQLAAQVRSETFQEQLGLILDDAERKRFTRLAVTSVLTNPQIAEDLTDLNSFFSAILACAGAGLVPDGKEAAIVVRKGKASFQEVVGGIQKIAADSGWLLRTAVVYANDEFDYTDEPPTIRHCSVRPGHERGELVAAYAIATDRAGRRLQEVLSPEDVAQRREKAQTQRFWEAWTPQMWRKSAAHALFARNRGVFSGSKIERVLAAELEQGDSLAAMYGPQAREVSQDPPAAPADAATAPVSVPGAGGEGQQAADVTSPSPRASAAPDPDDDPEPGGEPDFARGNAEAAGRQPLPATQPPIRGLTIAQAHAEHPEEFRQWCEWALKQTAYAADAPDLGKRHFGNALRAFLAVHAPDMLGERRAA